MLIISDCLGYGPESAKTGRELADLLGVSTRDIAKAVEQARRAGIPICASSSGIAGGYYIATTKDEVKTYCASLLHRAGEIHATRRACLKAMDSLPEGTENEASFG